MSLQIKSYQELVDRLFELPFVRYAVVTNEFGLRYSGGMKPGVESTTPNEVEKKLEGQAVSILRVAESYERYDGKLVCITIKWEKVVAVFCRLGSGRGILILTLEGASKPEALVEVLDIVEYWKQNES